MPGELTDRERLDLYEMSRMEGDEIEGEHLRIWRAKGYPLVYHGHGSARPCFWCSLSRLSDSLPTVFHGG